MPAAHPHTASGRPPRIVFAGGGTGGHLFPGIAVAEEIRRRRPDADISFVGTSRGIEFTQVPRYGFVLHVLPVQPLRGRSWRECLDGSLCLPRSLWRSLRRMRELDPDVVVSVGGYAAGPATLAARVNGAPCVVMEQNAFAGLTNRLLARVASDVLLSLPNAQLGRHRAARVVGNPVRGDLIRLGEQPLPTLPARFDATRPLRVLAFGGSQGARALNEALMALAPILARAQLPIDIVHQTGVADEQRVMACYQEHGLSPARMRATRFVDDMASAMGTADLLLCRSGSSTLAETAVVGRASWLVPYPFAADDHQTANARIFVDAGAARLLPQPQLSASLLLDWLEEALRSPHTLTQMAEAARRIARPRAVHDIADVVLSHC